MPLPTISEEEFIKLWDELGSCKLMAAKLKISERSIQSRRVRIQHKLGRELIAHNSQRPDAIRSRHNRRIDIQLKEGIGIVFGDCHYWPGDDSTAHRALVKFIDHFRPDFVVCNGDAFDGASISRHPKIGFEHRPTVKEEIDMVKEKLTEIEQAGRKDTQLFWTLGNHDLRFESILAAHLPQMEDVHGMALKDHFPIWKPCYTVMVNDQIPHITPTKIKHRFKGGDHAAFNNTLRSGVNIITNHLHQPNVRQFRDDRGVRYGCDTGCIAAVDGKQFNYLEDNEPNWGSGFAVLTFREYNLLPPELVQVWDENEGSITFRGAVDYV